MIYEYGVKARRMIEDRAEGILKSAHRQLRRKYKGRPLWSFVADMTGHGSTYSTQICKGLGWNPEQDAGSEIEWEVNDGFQ